MSARLDRRSCVGLLAAAALCPGWARSGQLRTIALLFDSLISPFWTAALERLRDEIRRRGWAMLEAVSNMDDNRQYQQVLSMIQRRVDGIIMVHTDDKAVIPAIRAANRAGVPLIHFNRPPAPNDGYSVAVVADNRKLMDDTVTALINLARRQGGHYKAALLLGDLSDANGAHRRDGIQDALQRNTDLVEVVARVATEWNADKAFAGLSNALQAHPDINFLVTSSDFMTPQIEQALRAAGKWHPAGHPGHVLIAGFDGDDNGYQALAAGYFDVDGVQNLDFEVEASLRALEQLWAGEHPRKILTDAGFVITRDGLDAKRDQMWGYGIWKGKSGALIARKSSAPVRAGSVVLDAAVNATHSQRIPWSVMTLAAVAFAQALFSVNTVHDVVLAILPLAIVAAGQLLVLLIGQIDLSVTAVMALGSIVSASLMTRGTAGWSDSAATAAGIATCIAVGAGVGLFNGIATVLLRIPSFVVTLAVMTAGNGAAVWYASSVSDTVSIGGLPSAFRSIGYGTVGGISIAFILSTAVLALIHFMLSRTVPGRWLYAMGRNAQAARISGVPLHAMSLMAFIASGICAALAAIIYTSRQEAGIPSLGQNMLLDIIGAVVIGGVSLLGGRGNIWMVLWGAAFLCLLDKSLQLLGVSLFAVLAVKGTAILVAALLDVARSRRSEQT